MTKMKRSSGLLLHPTSLPGPFGIGEIGEHAYRWIDFLVESYQSVWQILPLGPTGYGNSPYQTTSVFAGNPLLIDVARLAAEGFLSQEELERSPTFPNEYVDYDAVIRWKMPLLLETYQAFSSRADERKQAAFQSFCSLHDEKWLNDFALFMALKNRFEEKAWSSWPIDLKLRDPEALSDARRELSGEIIAHKFLQYQFYEQWLALKQYANERGIQILGDIPIYITYDSADVWANRSKYCLDQEGNPTVVAGVPPDYFSATGQLWGNPIYNWEAMAENGFRWWIERVKNILQCVDIIRLDHFRGFEAYWAVPFDEETAVNGKWIKGPDAALFQALLNELGDLPIVAEDLGVITPAVEALRDRFGFPGMKILQFSFGNGPDNLYLPHNYIQNCVVYTGSHDNDTTHGWFNTASEQERRYCLQYFGGELKDVSWDLMRLASASVALLAIFPVQDVLSLGTEARMNMPGQPSGNWAWRLLPDQLREKHRRRLAELSEIYGRAPLPEQETEE